MNKIELKEIRKYFTKMGDYIYCSPYMTKSRKCKRYYHKWLEFNIVVFNDDSVYQCGTEADTIGVELKTIEEFRVRFESFTGETLKGDLGFTRMNPPQIIEGVYIKNRKN